MKQGTEENKIMDKIREAKKNLGLSNNKFAELTETSRVAAIQNLRGDNPRLKTLIKMAKAVKLKLKLET